MSDLIPAGYYRAVAIPVDIEPGVSTYVQFGESKNQNPQAVVNFEILDGPESGRRITWFGYFTEKTTQRTIESLRYCGFKGDDLAALVTQTIDQEVQIVVGHEDYNGKTMAKIQWVNRAGGGGFKLEKPMDRGGLMQFAARMRNSVKQVPDTPGKKAERGAKPTSQSQSEEANSGGPPAGWSDGAAPVADDDIPF